MFKMDIIYLIICNFVYLVIGTILIRWYTYKKSGEKSIAKPLIFTAFWKSLTLSIIIIVRFLSGFFFNIDFSNPYDSYNFSLYLMMISFTLDIFLGLILFKSVFKQNIHESIVIILIIVIIELIIENVVLYFLMLNLILNS